MNNNLYIPKRIIVGYQERGDTYTKRLAYVIYFDDKGVLRKEKSWDGWRDKKIEPDEFDNNPQSGFVLNKNIERYKWSHFGSNRSLIRIYDPRGIEFEITPENLIAILTNSDCLRRGLDGEFVYAWSGSDLVLLPTSSEEYQKAKDYTSLQSKKVNAKNLIPGAAYKNKQGKVVTYIGRFSWYKFIHSQVENPRTNDYYTHSWYKTYTDYYTQSSSKEHIFTDDGKHFYIKSGLSFLAEQVSGVVSNYNEILDNFKKDIHSSRIIAWLLVPVEIKSPKLLPYDDKYVFTSENDLIKEYLIDSSFGGEKYSLRSARSIDPRTNIITSKHKYEDTIYENISETGPCPISVNRLVCKLENGERVKIKNLGSISY